MHELIGDQAMWLAAWTVLSSDYYDFRTPINTYTIAYDEERNLFTISPGTRDHVNSAGLQSLNHKLFPILKNLLADIEEQAQVPGRFTRSFFEFCYSSA